MLNMNYINSTIKYAVNFKTITSNIIEIKGDFPIQTDGIQISRDKKPDDIWDYSDYTTIYREIEGGVQFSNDGSAYVEPEPTPEPEPYVPTLEEVQERKVAEMNTIQQAVIAQGIDVTLTDGTEEHFTLTERDQISLMGLQAQVVQGMEMIPWHTSDQSEHCKFYSNADMLMITTLALSYVTWHVTYFRDLRIYIRSLQTKEEVEAVVYGMNIPEEYQAEPLKAMMTVQEE